MANGKIGQMASYWEEQQSPELESLKEKYKGLQPWQVELRDPDAYKALYEQEEVAPQGFADQNALTDFLGNLAWTAGSELSFGALTGVDLYNKGLLSEEFGVQEWEDNSWAGRLGGIAGQGVGFVSGIGLVGKGLKGLAKATGFGSKTLSRGAGKKIRSETAETLNKIVGEGDDALMNDFGEELYQAGTKAIKTGREEAATAFGRKTSKVDPFESFDLESSINKNFDELMEDAIRTNPNFGDNVVQNLLDPVNKEARDNLRSTVLRTAQEYTSENIPRVLALRGSQLGLGESASQIAGDMAFEATLLGIHGGLRNLVEKGTSAMLDLNDEHYGRRSFISDVLHGARTGAFLAPVRYIGGGAKVEWQPGKAPTSGVSANVLQAGKSVIRKFNGKKATDYTPKQLQTMMRNIYYGSNKNTEFFRGIEGWTPRLVEDAGMLANSANVKVLQKTYDKVSKDLSKNLLPMLTREVGRDLFQSFPRYTAGSIVMNGEHWYKDWEHLSADQIISDYFVGAFYMKRGKTLAGDTPAKRFLGSKDIKGDEVAKFSKAFDIMGWDKGKLDFMGSAWDKIYEDHMVASHIVQQSNQSTPELRNANSILEKDMVPTTEFVEQLKQPGLRSWNEWTAVEYTKELDRAADLRKAGNEGEARRVELAATDMLRKSEVARILVDELNFGVSDKNIQAMDKVQALEFVDRINNIEINGKKLTLDNASNEIQKLRKAASYKTTAQLSATMEDYIKNSLNAFGLWDKSMEVDGTIEVHPNTINLLMKKLSSNPKLDKYSDAIMTLHDVLLAADKTGVIRLNERALEWSGQTEAQKLQLDRFLDEYRINTERMHDLVMGTENSGWRDLVPNKKSSDAFLNEHILSSDPLWHAINTNQLHLRNDVGLQILTGKGVQGTEQVMFLNEKLQDRYFKGSRKLTLTDEDATRTISDKPHLLNLLKNVNRAWQVTEGSTKKGQREITIAELDNLHQDLSKQVGNLFTDNNSFNAFKNYLDNNFVDGILGDATSYGAKRAITDLLSEGNPLAFTDPVSNRRVIASGKAIREQILSSEYGQQMIASDPNFGNTVRELVRRYTKEIESVTKGKGGFIEFSDLLTIQEGSIHSAKDWMQTLMGMETLLDGSKITDVTRVLKNVHTLESLNSAFNTASHMEQLAKVATNRISVEDLKASMDKLRLNTRNLSAVLTDAIQNNDFLMLRSIVDKQYDIDRAINRAKQFTREGKGSLDEVASVIEQVALESVNERNKKLSLDSIESVDDFIKRQEEVVTRKDRSGRPILESQTISESQYKSKYGTDQNLLDLIKGNLVTLAGETTEAARLASSFLSKFPQLKDMPIERSDIFNNLEKVGISAEAYMSSIVKPIIEAEFVRAKVLNENLSYETFLTDTAQLLVSAWSQKKVAIGNYENGDLRISQKSVTNWDAGFLGIINSLGIANKPNSFMLFGESTIGGNRIQTKLSESMLQEINAKLALGTSPKIARSELFSAKENEQLKELLDTLPRTGEGQDGKPQFQIFRLDEKQSIVLSTSTYKDIVNRWKATDGPLRRKLSEIVGEDKANNYLENVLKISEFKNDNTNKQSYSTETIEGLLLTTRLLKDNAYYLDKIVNGEMTRAEVFKALKYMKLSNPRGGITLNNTTLDIMRYFTKEIMPDTPQYRDMKRHFESQMNRPHKQVTIYDEKGPGENFFNSDTHTRQVLKKQFMQEGGMTEKEATARANEIADKIKPEAKSIVDGEIYLSLPEMTALLTARGADASWFVWDGNNIVGFNTVIKPVVSQSKVNANGTIDVVMDKTAYKYDPTMDSAMRNADGTYFTDSIAFKSASKVNQTKSTTGEWSENAIPLTTPKDVTAPWKPQVALELQTQRGRAGSDLKLVEIDRANMMLKSISGPHDGTLSMAFGNFLSNPAQDVMNSWLGSGKVVSDLNQSIADLYNNPFAFKAVAEKLSKFDKEVGDITASMTGLEAVLAEGGIPIFEHMRPQIERALVGNYLGSRNFASGQISNGAYNVMTAADGLSLPIRENGMQKRFGGSGVPHFEANKNIRTLLQDPGGVESISLVFQLSKQQAKDLNTLFNTHGNQKAKSDLDLFRHGDDIIVSGDGNIAGTFDGYINRVFSDQITGAARKDAMIARATAQEVANGILGKNYRDIIERAKNATEGGEAQVNTLGELVRFIDGNPLSAADRQISSTYHRDYTITNGERSVAKEMGYQSVRVADVNLRTPKDGLNSWVLTGIEKLIDQRKGAVSEMNSKDLINPQDADFDLDKSASFFGTPGKIVKEIHAASGYHEISSEQIWEKAAYELSIEQPQLQSYVNELKSLESARPTIVRQHSLTSLLYQYFGSLDGLAKRNILKPGYDQGVTRDVTTGEAFRTSESITGVNVIGDMQIGRERYQIEFRHGAEFVDAIGHMKKVIKHTIDTYGDLSKLNERDMMDTFWFSEDVGLFKLTRTDFSGMSSEIPWGSVGLPQIETVKRRLKNNILRPMNQIFNLGLGYETLSNGSTRKLGFYDHVKTFERAKDNISELVKGDKYTPELAKFADEFLGFLGEFPGRAGTSNHPLIDGLMKMEKMHNRNFPLRIERGSELGNILAGTPVDNVSKSVQDAVGRYMGNERNWARFQSLQWEVNQLENILNDMRSRRQHETSNYTDMSARKDMLTKALGKVEVVLNDKIVQNYNAANRKGFIPEADADYAVYRKGEKGGVDRIRKGQPVSWNAGDVVVKNPRTFRFSDPIQQKHLRTMNRAFGVQLPGVEKFDVSDTRGYIRSTVEDVQRKFRDIDQQFSDASVKNNSFYSDLYTSKLEILKDTFSDAMTARGPQYAKQLLYSLLTPRVSTNEMSILNYDNKNDSYYSGFRFRSNKMNESVIFRFMNAAMDGKVSGFNQGIAKEWFKEMMQAQKVSYLMTHDKSLSGDAFKIGNMNRGIEPTFNVLPTTEVKPRLLNAKVNNEQARNTIQSYLTGSYFLDPIELYRLTVGLDKTMNELPSPQTMGERVKNYWQDVGQNARTIEINEGMGDAIYRLSKSPIENSMNGNREHIRRKSFSEKLWEEINCNN